MFQQAHLLAPWEMNGNDASKDHVPANPLRFHSISH